MQAWNDFITRQEEALGKEATDKWLRTLKVAHFDACNLYLDAPDTFHALWFEEQVRARVKRELKNPNGRPIHVHLSVVGGGPSKKERSKPKPQDDFTLTFDSLSPYATLDHFAPLSGNQLAYAALSRLSAAEPGTYNPLFLHGPHGSGKTHLLMSACHAWEAEGKRVLYSRGETFTAHVVSAIRGGGMKTFRNVYRNVDLLVIDGVDALSKKGATQEELFHTFNALHIERKQIILSATVAPSELRFIEPRLISRFEWGLVAPLQLPTIDELPLLLEAKSKAMKTPLTDDLKSFLLSTFQRSPAGLVRAFEALVLNSHLDGPLTVNRAQQLLAPLIQEERHSAPTPQKVVNAVAAYYTLQPKELLGKSQKRGPTLARQLAMYLCRNTLKLPFTQIGDIFERDHSTVMTSVKQIDKKVSAKEAELVSALSTIKTKL